MMTGNNETLEMVRALVVQDHPPDLITLHCRRGLIEKVETQGSICGEDFFGEMELDPNLDCLEEVREFLRRPRRPYRGAPREAFTGSITLVCAPRRVLDARYTERLDPPWKAREK